MNNFDEHIALKDDINTLLMNIFGQHSFQFSNEIQISFRKTNPVKKKFDVVFYK